MKAVLVGLGMVADMHALSCLDSDKVTLHGICARRQATAAAYAQKLLQSFGMEVRIYRDIAEIAADPEVDFVIIATPPSAREALIAPLVEAGKPILLEKPVARTLEEARKVVSICAGRVPLGMVFQHQMRAGSEKLGELMPLLGALHSVQIDVPWWRPQSYYDEPGRGTYAQDGGGVLLTQAIHILELALSLTGPAARVQAMARTSATHKMEAEDFVAAGVEFANGAVGVILATTANFPGATESITLNCAQGSAVLARGVLDIHWRDGRHGSFGAEDDGSGGGADPMAFKHGWHQAVIEDFVAAVLGGQAPRVTGQKALQVHALIEALIRSSSAGKMVEVAHV
ncbi:MAG: Gfo/Idh/MocA family oxidoreductase [Pseudomonadota bacterium]